MKRNEAQEGMMQPNLFEGVFDTLSVGIIVSDRAGKIARMNTAALKLFVVDSEALYRGTPFRQFLHHYEIKDEQRAVTSLEPWLVDLIAHEETSDSQEKIKLLQLPSEQKSYITLRSSPMHDAQHHVVGTVHVFHNITHKYQKALHLQRVHQAALTLTEAVGRISEQKDLTFPQETCLLSPPVLAVEQPLVDLIAQVLECRHVAIWALGPPAGQVYYAAGSGFTAEQEQYRQEISGHFFPYQVLDERSLDRLRDNEAVILPVDEKRFPPEVSVDVRVKQWLIVPLFLKEQLAGGLIIDKADFDSYHTHEEIEFVKAVATNTMLLLECFCLCKQVRTEDRALAQQEMHRLTNDFLNLASHELNTPLTAIKGNVQVAQRRLAALKRQLAAQSEPVSENIERFQDTLEAAAQGVRLQEHLIERLLDDARVQANKLELTMQRSDLRALLREAVASKQHSVPQHPIVLEIMPSENMVPILADAARITRVINTYLEHALSFSPADQPVIVQLTVEDTVARVSVRDAGPAISLEEQGRIWERFHSAKRAAGEQESDRCLGLDFYLSRAFIERHHGNVGMQSDSGHGATFWFTLPIEASPTGPV